MHWYANFFSHGLLTRSRAVSEFMVGLEKIKARSGEISQSARALTLDNMHCLYDYCMRSTAPPKEQRWGIVRYVCQLLFNFDFELADC
jgi:hypothetical protein